MNKTGEERKKELSDIILISGKYCEEKIRQEKVTEQDRYLF